MAYLETLFGPHASRLQESLGRTSARQGVLMTNLSNVNVPGYKRQDMDFHIQLRRAMDGTEQSLTNGRTAPGVDPYADDISRDEAEIRLDGSSVDMEREIVNIAETEAHYNALTELTSRYFSGLKNVIREGR